VPKCPCLNGLDVDEISMCSLDWDVIATCSLDVDVIDVGVFKLDGREVKTPAL